MGKKRILVVDDEQKIREMYSQVFLIFQQRGSRRFLCYPLMILGIII
jgi:DNA-binding response OmpR family regulator